MVGSCGDPTATIRATATTRPRRWGIILAATGVLALTGGCVHQTVRVSAGTVAEAWPEILDDGAADVPTRGGDVSIDEETEVFTYERAGNGEFRCEPPCQLADLRQRFPDLDAVWIDRSEVDTATLVAAAALAVVGTGMGALAACGFGGLGCEGDEPAYASAGFFTVALGFVLLSAYAISGVFAH